MNEPRRTALALATLLSLSVACRSEAPRERSIPEPEEVGGIRVILGLTFADRATGPLEMDVYLPTGRGPFPAVQTIHGGGFVGGSRSDMRGISTFLARNGYAAFSIDYRLAPAATYPAQVEDASDAIAFAREHSAELSIDPNRIGILGSSAGATIGATVAGEAGLDVLATVLWSGAYDLPALVVDGPAVAELRLGGYVGAGDLSSQEALAALQEASPITLVSADYPPTLLANAEQELMPIEQALEMRDRLRGFGVPQELFVPSGGHGIAYAREAAEPSLRFLDTYLRS